MKTFGTNRITQPKYAWLVLCLVALLMSWSDVRADNLTPHLSYRVERLSDTYWAVYVTNNENTRIVYKLTIEAAETQHWSNNPIAPHDTTKWTVRGRPTNVSGVEQ